MKPAAIAASPHWAEPSAPDEAAEARYHRAVVDGESPEAFGAAEGAGDTPPADHAEAERWDAIYRAAVCAAADAIRQRDWTAKRQALAVTDQAKASRDLLLAEIFGAKKVPAQYADMERAGRLLTRADSSAALKVIAADKAPQPAPVRRPTPATPAQRGTRFPSTVTGTVCYLGGGAYGIRCDRTLRPAREIALAGLSAADKGRAITVVVHQFSAEVLP